MLKTIYLYCKKKYKTFLQEICYMKIARYFLKMFKSIFAKIKWAERIQKTQN